MASFAITNATTAQQGLLPGEVGAVLLNGAIIVSGIGVANAVGMDDATLFVSGLIHAENGASIWGTGNIRLTVAAAGMVTSSVVQAGAPGATTTITNAGLIQGNDGINHTDRGAFQLTNTGTINGTSFNAMFVSSSSTIRVINDGLISSAGSGLFLGGTGGVRIVNTGTIAADLAVFHTGSGAMNVTNSGTIVGGVTMGGGNDRFDGRGGDQTSARIDGGAGNDTLMGSEASDALSGGIGNDRLRGYGGNDELYGGDGDDNIRGNDGDDYVEAGAGNDDFGGGRGYDYVLGGDGNDNLRGGDDGDEIYGEAGNDSLSGGTGNDLLDGGDGNDTIAGGDDDDLIYGGAGADIITGGKGNDTMDGGPQADRFVFARGHGHDEIVGFQNNTDKLDLSAFGFANAGAVRALAAMRPDGLFIDLSSVGGDSILISSGLRLGQLDAADMVL